MNEVVSRLHPPRLPEAFTTLTWGDYTLAFALGLILMAGLLALLRPLLARREGKPKLGEQLKEVQSLDPAEQPLALARLAHLRGLSLTQAERAALYDAKIPLSTKDLANRIKGGKA